MNISAKRRRKYSKNQQPQESQERAMKRPSFVNYRIPGNYLNVISEAVRALCRRESGRGAAVMFLPLTFFCVFFSSRFLWVELSLLRYPRFSFLYYYSTKEIRMVGMLCSYLMNGIAWAPCGNRGRTNFQVATTHMPSHSHKLTQA